MSQQIQVDEDESTKALWLDYRKTLIECEQKSQEQYDKAVIVLSGGALAVSIAFIKDVLGDAAPVHTEWLAVAWGAWGISLACILFSFWFSSVALRKTITQVDVRKPHEGIVSPGDKWTTVLKWLNFAGGALFVAGAVCLFVFAYHNLNPEKGACNMSDKKPPETRGYVPPAAPKIIPNGQIPPVAPPVTTPKPWTGQIPPPPPPTKK